MPANIARLIHWLIVIIMPFFLGFSAIELMVNNAERYVEFEYAKPNFPRDLALVNEVQQQRLGLEPFTQAERQELALVAVEYLKRSQPAEDVIYLLEEQTLPGTDSPLYNEAELSHMVDVKHLTDAISRLNLFASFIVIGGLFVLLLMAPHRELAYRAIFRGGVATTALLLLIGLFILLAWNIFFVQFHELLFPPGTWQFAYSDSLIRLFPEMFWFDFGVLLSIVALSLGVITTLAGWFLSRETFRA